LTFVEKDALRNRAHWAQFLREKYFFTGKAGEKIN
jgi:hypothetical protein